MQPDIIDQPLAKVETAPLAERPQSEVGALIRLALEKGQNPTELYAILAEERKAQAESAFIKAKANFQAECPPVPKSQVNPQFTATVDGVKRVSMFAPLDAMQTLADPHLANNGFSYDWQEGPSTPDGKRQLLFILSHVGGHSKQYPARITEPSKGGCSEPQKDGIAYEYARRQSFRNGTGIRVVGEDNDGNIDDAKPETVTEEQARTLNDLLIAAEEISAGTRTRMLAWAGAAAVADVPASKFNEACSRLNATIKKGKP